MYDLDTFRKGTLTAASGYASVIAVGYDQKTGDYNHNKMRGISTVAVDIRGTFTATVQFEGTVDGTNWVAVTGYPSGGGTGVTSATTTGAWFFPVAGFRNFRVRCSAYTSTPTVAIGTFVSDLHGLNGGAAPVDTELPTAAALADNAANPTAPAVGAFAMVWDGTTWDRAPGTTNGAEVVVRGNHREVSIVPTVDTNVYAAGDTLFDRTIITNAVRAADADAYLVGLAMMDVDDEAAAQVDLYFLSADVAFGTINAAPSISDANGVNIIGKITINSSDWTDLGGFKIATKCLSDVGFPLLVSPASGTRNVYVAAVTQGTPTYTAGTDVKLRLFFKDEV
jgi:hypothetical protein